MTNIIAEPIAQFEARKRDHIQHALDPANEATERNCLDSIHLVHEAIPDMNFDEIDLSTDFFGHTISSPMFISSMTAGHPGGVNVNEVLVTAASTQNWPMGVGSQRRELFDAQASTEWANIRKQAPNALLMGNIGLSQVIQAKTGDIQRLVDALEAKALFIHTNPLQECLQPEGTPYFKDSYAAIEQLCMALSVPVIIKEVGCGFSRTTLAKLNGLGVAGVDVSGLGGTHWGRIEGARAKHDSRQAKAAQTFRSWGETTLSSLAAANDVQPDYAIWASGGVRSGLDCAKLISRGANMVGLAKPMLEKAQIGVEAVIELMIHLEYELKIALFCTGNQSPAALAENTPCP